jgi:hypothetical protein
VGVLAPGIIPFPHGVGRSVEGGMRRGQHWGREEAGKSSSPLCPALLSKTSLLGVSGTPTFRMGTGTSRLTQGSLPDWLLSFFQHHHQHTHPSPTSSLAVFSLSLGLISYKIGKKELLLEDFMTPTKLTGQCLAPAGLSYQEPL